MAEILAVPPVRRAEFRNERKALMKATIDQLKTPGAKSGTKPESKDDLKSLPMADVQKK